MGRKSKLLPWQDHTPRPHHIGRSWRPGDLETWRPGDLSIWRPARTQSYSRGRMGYLGPALALVSRLAARGIGSRLQVEKINSNVSIVACICRLIEPLDLSSTTKQYLLWIQVQSFEIAPTCIFNSDLESKQTTKGIISAQQWRSHE